MTTNEMIKGMMKLSGILSLLLLLVPSTEVSAEMKCIDEVTEAKACVTESCNGKAIYNCVNEMALNTKVQSYDDFGPMAAACFSKEATDTGNCKFDIVPDNDGCFHEKFPKALKCVMEENVYGECLLEYSTKFLECTHDHSSNCNFDGDAGKKQCQAAKYWDPEGYDSLRSIVKRTPTTELCPEIDHSWIKPICGMTDECCGSCMENLKPLLTCMIDKVLLPNTPSVVEDEDAPHFCYADDYHSDFDTREYKQDVCEFDFMHHNRRTHVRRNLWNGQEEDDGDNLGLDDEAGVPPLENIDKKATTLDHCERILALNFALNKPGRSVNEYMKCLLQVAAVKTYQGPKDGEKGYGVELHDSSNSSVGLFFLVSFAIFIAFGVCFIAMKFRAYYNKGRTYGMVRVNAMKVVAGNPNIQEEEGDFFGGGDVAGGSMNGGTNGARSGHAINGFFKNMRNDSNYSDEQKRENRSPKKKPVLPPIHDMMNYSDEDVRGEDKLVHEDELESASKNINSFIEKMRAENIHSKEEQQATAGDGGLKGKNNTHRLSLNL